MKRTDPKRKAKKKRAWLWISISAAALFLLAGGILAKYVTANRNRAEMLSSDFHFSSDYLEEVTDSHPLPTYSLFDMSEIHFELYNYEKTNICLINKEEIKYRLTVPEGWTVTVKCGDETVQPDGEGLYTIPAEPAERKNWSVTLTGGSADEVTVIAETVSPYKLTLQAKFVQTGEQPSYTVVDKGNYRLLTIKSNNYEGAITVNWACEKLSPDNTNPLMREWRDSPSTGTVSVAKNHVYELIFVENTPEDAANQSGTGTVINVGGEPAGPEQPQP